MLGYLAILLVISLIMTAILSLFRKYIPLSPRIIYGTVGISFALGAFFPKAIASLSPAGVTAVYFGLIIIIAIALSYNECRICLNTSTAPVEALGLGSESTEPEFAESSEQEYPESTEPEFTEGSFSSILEEEIAALEAAATEEVAVQEVVTAAEETVTLGETDIIEGITTQKETDITEEASDVTEVTAAGEAPDITEETSAQKETGISEEASDIIEEITAREAPGEAEETTQETTVAEVDTPVLAAASAEEIPPQAAFDVTEVTAAGETADITEETSAQKETGITEEASDIIEEITAREAPGEAEETTQETTVAEVDIPAQAAASAEEIPPQAAFDVTEVTAAGETADITEETFAQKETGITEEASDIIEETAPREAAGEAEETAPETTVAEVDVTDITAAGETADITEEIITQEASAAQDQLTVNTEEETEATLPPPPVPPLQGEDIVAAEKDILPLEDEQLLAPDLSLDELTHKVIEETYSPPETATGTDNEDLREGDEQLKPVMKNEKASEDNAGTITSPVTIIDYISAGFDAKNSGDMAGAVKYFLAAFQKNREQHISTTLAMEISAVYQELGQYFQAGLIIRSVLEQENMINESLLRKKLISQLKHLETLVELLKAARMPNAPYSKIPNIIKIKANLEVNKKLKELTQGGE